MQNTILVDTDLLYSRSPAIDSFDDDLVEIAFEDMEPIPYFDVVGIEPHTAIAILPHLDFDMVGVAPYGAVAITPAPAFPRAHEASLEADAIPTEEFSSWEASAPSGALLDLE